MQYGLMTRTFLLYGATGYTGALIAEHAKERGLQLILSGRNQVALEQLASRLSLPYRAAAVDDEAALSRAIEGVDAVLNCAGPFSRTMEPVARACLKAGKHYLDITGELNVFEALHNRDEEARRAGVTLLPGVGFDVVPSDCLAAHLKRRMPEAKRLMLGLVNTGAPSRGTAITMLENVYQGGAVRQGGRITQVPVAWKSRKFDYGREPSQSIIINWGDVSTAFYSTGIPDIEVYAAFVTPARIMMRLGRYLGPILASGPVQRLLKKQVMAGPPGPDAEARARGWSVLVGEVEDGAGRKVSSRLNCPDPYVLTIRTALLAIQRVLDGKAQPGFMTPSLAFGPDFVLEAEGVTREDLT